MREAAIAERFGLDPARIICGNGSDDLLSLWRMPSGPATRGSTASRLPVYPIAIRAAGGTPVAAPESDFTADVDAMLAA